MFVRIKTTPNSPRRSVQLVEGVRDGGKVRQRIVRHIGVAMDEDELERLRQLGEYVKAKLEDERQPLLFAPEKIADQVIRVGRQGDGKQELPVDLKQLEEEQRLITGVHEVYGEMYRQLGLDGLLPRSRYRASHDALFHVVMARIANPDSKRGSVRRLEEDFGVSLPLEKVYRMMDQLDAPVINYLRTRVGEASRSLLPEPVALKKKVLDLDAYGPLEGSENRRVGEWEHKGQRLIVVFCPERARKDAHERRQAVARLLDKLERSDNPKELLSNRRDAVPDDARIVRLFAESPLCGRARFTDRHSGIVWTRCRNGARR